MSKSLGNFFTVRDLLDQGVPGEVIRFVFLSTHYRKPMDWTEKKRQEAEATLKKWYAIVGDQCETPLSVVAALSDDLNTSLALTELHRLATAGDFNGLRGGMALLGLIGECAPDWATTEVIDLSQFAELLVKARATAMETKDFSRVDELKLAFVSAGLEVRMSKEGVELVPGPNFDAAKLESLS